MSCLEENVRWLNLVASWGVSPCYFAYLVAFVAKQCNVRVDEVIENLLYDGWQLVVEAHTKGCFEGSFTVAIECPRKHRRRRKRHSSLFRRSTLRFCSDDDTEVYGRLVPLFSHRLYHVIQPHILM
ncbi:MAG TPA: hypothetical protein EYH59_05170 [Pyrodictium sp.]|nr:hypothetical protein [Pyrodictium sp.]